MPARAPGAAAAVGPSVAAGAVAEAVVAWGAPGPRPPAAGPSPTAASVTAVRPIEGSGIADPFSRGASSGLPTPAAATSAAVLRPGAAAREEILVLGHAGGGSRDEVGGPSTNSGGDGPAGFMYLNTPDQRS